MGKRSLTYHLSLRTEHGKMCLLDVAYVDGKFIIHELEDPSKYLRDGKPCKKRSWLPPRDPDAFTANFDASGSVDKKSFGYGFIIRNAEGELVLEGFGHAADPCGGKSTCYMECYAFLKMLEKVNAILCLRLEARCDNKTSIDVLKGAAKLDKFEHASEIRPLVNLIKKIKDEKYPLEKALCYQWVPREENFVADLLSHLGKRLQINTDHRNPRKLLSKNWTFKSFMSRDSPNGKGFCMFPDVKQAVTLRHNAKKKKVLRCPNCNIFGHIGEDCKMKPLEKQCRECGGVGHIGKDCKAEPIARDQYLAYCHSAGVSDSDAEEDDDDVDEMDDDMSMSRVLAPKKKDTPKEEPIGTPSKAATLVSTRGSPSTTSKSSKSKRKASGDDGKVANSAPLKKVKT